jgi:hypothetical protein
MKRVLAAAVLLWALTPSTAHAAEKLWDGGYDIKAQRRSGFAGAVNFGLGVGKARGYPNAVSQIDDPDYRSSTGTTGGSTFSLWLGGAIRDWFTVGLGFSTFGAASGNIKAGGNAFILHVEAFPLFNYGGRFRDFALFTNVGAGGLVIEGDAPEKANGGFMSVLGFGASYELFRFGAVALGPVLEGTYRFSQSVTAGGVFAGVRTTIYSGP